MIVSMARKLAIEFLRYLETGLIPEGDSIHRSPMAISDPILLLAAGGIRFRADQERSMTRAVTKSKK